MPTLRANVNAAMLTWARKSAGYSHAEAAKKILGHSEKGDQVKAWETGDAQPTVRQLFKIADVYGRPLGTFYLSEFPADFTIPRDFRRLPGEVAGVYSPDLRTQLRIAGERREAILELLQDIGEEVAPFGLRAQLDEPPDEVANRIRAALRITIGAQQAWRDRQRYKQLNEWRSRIEALGVLVFQAATVETSEMLGFALVEERLPVVTVNRKLKPNGRIFTLLHEFVHVMLRESGISDFSGNENSVRPEVEQRIEVFCNRVAGAALVPADALLEEPEIRAKGAASENWSDADIANLAERYGVSREVIVRRMMIVGRTTEAFYLRKREEYRVQFEEQLQAEREREEGGPENRAARAISILGPGFVRMVLEGHNQGHINLTQVSSLLGERLKWLPEIERKVRAA